MNFNNNQANEYLKDAQKQKELNEKRQIFKIESKFEGVEMQVMFLR